MGLCKVSPESKLLAYSLAAQVPIMWSDMNKKRLRKGAISKVNGDSIGAVEKVTV
jgi:hypothetical protein